MNQLIRRRDARTAFALEIAIAVFLTACAQGAPDAPAVEGEKLYLAESPAVASTTPTDAQLRQVGPFNDGEYSIDSANEPAAAEGALDKTRSCYVDLQWCRNPASGPCHNVPLCRTYSCQDRAENPNNDQVGQYCTSLIGQICGNVSQYCYTKN